MWFYEKNQLSLRAQIDILQHAQNTIFLVKTQHQYSDGEYDKIDDEIDASLDKNSSKRLVWASTI